MWIVFKRRKLIAGLFHKFICLLAFCFILISCGSSPVVRQLKVYDTYQTSLTNEDIMRSFVNEVRTYLQRYDSYGCYYFVRFEVFQDRDEQNYAWATYTDEKRYRWGTVYDITLHISNAWLTVSFCNTGFTVGSQDAREIVTTRSGTVGGDRIRENIADTAVSMFRESEMVLKMFNRNYSDELKIAFLTEIMRILL